MLCTKRNKCHNRNEHFIVSLLFLMQKIYMKFKKQKKLVRSCVNILLVVTFGFLIVVGQINRWSAAESEHENIEFN